ncbi:MAG: histidine phosphatase family protein [Gallionellaceae bacterium]
MDLILWRHAEAVDGLPDMDRALTKKGQQQATRMAEFLSARLPSDTRVLVSPALRTQQTASALNKKFITEPAISPGMSAQAAIFASGWPNASGTTLLVGHQPWIGEVASFLMTGTEHYWSVKKGSIIWLSKRQRAGYDETVLKLVIAPEQL